MDAAENKRILQQVFTGLAEGDPRPLVQALAEDFCWVITGNTKWSRRYEGKQTVLDELFARLRERIVGRIKTRAHRFIAEDDSVVVLARGDNLTVAGKRYDNDYCYVCRLRDGKLIELIEYFDTELVREALGDPAVPLAAG